MPRIIDEDVMQSMIEAYKLPRDFEDKLEGEAFAYESSGLRGVVPFFAWLAARGLGSLHAVR